MVGVDGSGGDRGSGAVGESGLLGAGVVVTDVEKTSSADTAGPSFFGSQWPRSAKNFSSFSAFLSSKVGHRGMNGVDGGVLSMAICHLLEVAHAIKPSNWALLAWSSL